MINEAPFFQTKQTHILEGSSGQAVEVAFSVSPTKGFVKEDESWINYRRNYFEIRCNISLMSRLNQGSTRLSVDGQGQVVGFHLVISAITTDGKDADLIQFTSQRSKGPRSTPSPLLVPLKDGPASVVFKRLQFHRATPKYNSPTRPKKHYLLKIQLMADFISTQSMCISDATSLPFLVRGRSPVHFS
ncbi:hypothetical protein DSO57_1008894 [Entomophthora muscae]|uniref:Uncharacterized protein n=1 Tax=Entomophthora muscae TaxID=34485 RepID=A0ACC2TUN7_9FUNG|nr:hypothetical protein DSO57_1008894 [Entomophthora muscae]